MIKKLVETTGNQKRFVNDMELSLMEELENYFSINKTGRTCRNKYRKVMKLLIKQDFKCFYCGTKIYHAIQNLLPVATVDHYIPKAAGGSNHLANLRAACKPCNHDKADKVPTVRRKQLLKG